MKHIACVLSLLLFASSLSASAQPSEPSPATRINSFDVWVGDWTLTGTAKDGPSMPEYKATWKLHGTRILGGAFIQVDQVWQGSGPELRGLEILYYDPMKKALSSAVFFSDGSTLTGTATFEGLNSIAVGSITAPDGSFAHWRINWVFSPDRMSITGTQEVEQDGNKWIGFSLKGTKAQSSAKK